MKKVLVSALCGVLIVCLVLSLWCIQNLLKVNDFNAATMRGLYTEAPQSLDMIYIGGSAATRFWSPLQAWNASGIASYVYGSDWLAPESIKHLMREASLTQSPALWVIDVRPFEYGVETAESRAKKKFMKYVSVRNTLSGMYPFSPNKAALINEYVPDPFEAISYYLDLLFYHGSWDHAADFDSVTDWLRRVIREGLTEADIRLALLNVSKHPMKGAILWNKAVPVSLSDVSAVTDETPIAPSLLQALTELLQECRSSGQQVLFIVHTYNQTAEQKRAFNFVKRIVEDYGFDFLNTNDVREATGIDGSTDYYDGTHVNALGMEKYTDFLTRYLREHYDLPDHRGESAYESWNEDYLVYREEAEKTKQVIRQTLSAPEA